MSDEIIAPAPAGKYMVDAYDNWARAEGVPVHEALAFDLNKVATKPWARMGVDGAICYLTGRDDYLTIHLLDLPPGGRTEPQRHLFEAVFYVVSGRGSMTVETSDGTTHTFEWGPRSVFAVPMNAGYRLFNASGHERARVAVVSDMRYLLQLYRSESFLFANPVRFPDREGVPGHYAGEGEFVAVRPGRHMWETNFVPDVAAIQLKEWAERGAGAASLRLMLADSVLGVHVSELPVGTYRKAHRHLPGYCIFAVAGTGYTLNWFEGDPEMTRIDWKPGVVYAPRLQLLHQHFNTGPTPARTLAVQYGSVRYPMTRDKAFTFDKGTDSSVQSGGGQIEYADQPPGIHALFLEELKKAGIEPRMEAFINR
jgi:mannose-6-phosphate isomerase-like protein (cupin superfamily)